MNKRGFTKLNPWQIVFVVVILIGIIIVFNYARYPDSGGQQLSKELAEPEIEVITEEGMGDQPFIIDEGANLIDEVAQKESSLESKDFLKETSQKTGVGETFLKKQDEVVIPKTVEIKNPLTIQVASFKDEATAMKTVDQLKKDGYAAFISSTNLKEKGTWHRVMVGRFQSKADAQPQFEELKNKFKDSFIRLL